MLCRGLDTITAAHDLDRDQLRALLDHAPRGRVAVTIHHHIPTFHTEHCVYAHLLSHGRDFRSCGRPCERHALALRDRVGLVHPVASTEAAATVFKAGAERGELSPSSCARRVAARSRWSGEWRRDGAVLGAYREMSPAGCARGGGRRAR